MLILKKYNKPNVDLSFVETTDVITTSSGEALNDIVKPLGALNAVTQSFDYTKLFE